LPDLHRRIPGIRYPRKKIQTIEGEIQGGGKKKDILASKGQNG